MTRVQQDRNGCQGDSWSVCQCGTGRDVSVHTANRRGGGLTIGRVTLGSSRCSSSSSGKVHCSHGLNHTIMLSGRHRLNDRQPLPVPISLVLKECLEDLFRMRRSQSYLGIAHRNHQLIISSYF